MLKILLSGCNGKMGRVITNLFLEQSAFKITAGFDAVDIHSNAYPVYKSLSECKIDIDVIIDFSNACVLEPLLEFALFRKIPIVIATTGHSEEQIHKIEQASRIIPIFRSANMSLGINLVAEFVEKAAKVLGDSFDIEIIEKHHNQKVDSPSGTALMLADLINSAVSEPKQYVFDRHSIHEKRKSNEIGIHSVRGGTIVGEHSTIFAGKDEIIEINHSALSRNVFGKGALAAVNFIYNQKPGLYSMKDIIKGY